MESIKEIFKTGYGPSSSHTMGPRKAAEIFRKNNPGIIKARVTLFGSLAATGKGHMTDKAILESMRPVPTEIIWQPDIFLPAHPNGIRFEALDKAGQVRELWTTYSIGGGDISDSGKRDTTASIYPIDTMSDILQWCETNGRNLWEFVEMHEAPDLWDYLSEAWKVMQEAIERGIDAEGVLPGRLNLARKASSYHTKAGSFKGTLARRAFTFAYALAVAEENASGGKIVTAPTCGSCGVVPAVLYLLKTQYDFNDKKILRGLATAGLIGNLIKTNASISGAEVGCQGEVGSASSMAAAAAEQMFGGTPGQIEYAASIAMEHFLGLTCDPLLGLVQIPCIERNAFGAARALDANMYALLSDGKHLVSFDRVLQAMKQTGHDLPRIYKETAEGGLAALGIR
ncbi:MAG TPA: L-serine ammonia-lyase [Bacteroidales bacterium]|mgnify:CR=1 FL=1|nr:L-serine ammonia-lyase [Bacteroidales bacterium]HPT10508.1 L-serine ammonia-lyase [Bacteroidales bacterium]